MNLSTSTYARVRAAFVLCLLLLCCVARAQAQQAAQSATLPAEKVKQIEELVNAEMAKQKIPGMTVAVCPTRPDSRGHVMARSADARDRPSILFNYLQQSSDLEVMRSGFRKVRRILAAPAFAPYDGGELKPGDHVIITGQPGRNHEDHRLHVLTISRPADRWEWRRGGRY